MKNKKQRKKRAIVVGSGAGGATVARELQGDFEVTILEAGKEFRPFSFPVTFLEHLRSFGLFFDEREIQWVFPAMKVRRTSKNMVLVNGIGTGGTTPIATGNAIRLDEELKRLGIDLDPEFHELSQELPISTEHEHHWNPTTKYLFQLCKDLGLDPQPTPKMGTYAQCRHCGRCVFGCPYGIKWDSRRFLHDALAKGAQLHTGQRVERIVIQDARAQGVIAGNRFASQFYPADLIVLSAGGLGTPEILERSGIPCQPRLFVDPVLCVAAEWGEANQHTELAMPFYFQQDRFMVSPYFDYLSFFFNKSWRKPASRIVSWMIKLSDRNEGTIYGRKVHKGLTEPDQRSLTEGMDLCLELFGKMGVQRDEVFLGTLNAGHPGGMLPLTEKEAVSLRPAGLPENVYVADATLLPKSPGGPPILTIMALAKKISIVIQSRCNS
ncbi:MAG: GMC family oxidoreductase [Spirochaetes bacterium]|nr:GMC family oxidoreductase [Spirochaetota bacterium]